MRVPFSFGSVQYGAIHPLYLVIDSVQRLLQLPVMLYDSSLKVQDRERRSF